MQGFPALKYRYLWGSYASQEVSQIPLTSDPQNWNVDAPASAAASGFDATFSPGNASWAADAPGAGTANGFDATLNGSLMAELGSAAASGLDASINGDLEPTLGTAAASGLDATFSPGNASWTADAPGSATVAGFDATLTPGNAPWTADAPGTGTADGFESTLSPGAVSWTADVPGTATTAGFDSTWSQEFSAGLGSAAAAGVSPDAIWNTDWVAEVGAALTSGSDASLAGGPVSWPSEVEGVATAAGLEAGIKPGHFFRVNVSHVRLHNDTHVATK